MATIPNQGTGLRHVRKTVTFTGGANAGAVDDFVTVFAHTGVVRIVALLGQITDDLISAQPDNTQLASGFKESSTTSSFSSATISALGSGGLAGYFFDPLYFDTSGSNAAATLSLDPLALFTRGDFGFTVQDFTTFEGITAGEIVIDCWYHPVTDDGALAGDDIDTELIAAVNAQAVDALATDTYAEPSSVPAATSSLKDKINWLFALARNKVTQSTTTQTLRNDADSASIATAAVSDDGSTFTRAEWS